jgi:hypothetical protein
MTLLHFGLKYNLTPQFNYSKSRFYYDYLDKELLKIPSTYSHKQFLNELDWKQAKKFFMREMIIA